MSAATTTTTSTTGRRDVSTERRRPPDQRLGRDRHRTTERHSASVSALTTPGTAERLAGSQLTMKDPDCRRSCTVCRPEDTAKTPRRVGRVRRAETADSCGAPVTSCRQRRCRSAGASMWSVSFGLRLLLVVAVLGSGSHAQPLHSREHLRRQTDSASHRQRPLPFSVDTYDEAVVRHAFCTQTVCSTISVRAFNVIFVVAQKLECFHLLAWYLSVSSEVPSVSICRGSGLQ